MSYSKEVLLESLFCIKEASQRLGFNYESFGQFNENLQVFIPNGKSLLFYYNSNPFNSSIASKICRSKHISMSFFKHFNVTTPDTVMFINPNFEFATPEEALFKNPTELWEHVTDKWTTPFIVKKSLSSFSEDVHLITSLQDTTNVWDRYFTNTTDQNNLLAQEFVSGREFRVISFKGKILLVYEKISDESLYERASHHDLNPLHSGRPQKITDPNILSLFDDITKKIYFGMQIDFTGIDVIVDKNNLPKVLEINSNPACYFYNGHYGREDFTAVYQECLAEYLR